MQKTVLRGYGNHQKKRDRLQGYPPQYRQSFHQTQRRVRTGLPIWSAAIFWLCYGYFHNWPSLLFATAPFFSVIFLLYAVIAIGDLQSLRYVCILPYYKKGDADAPKVEGDTFLHGKALARNCVFLDTLATRAGLETLSSFGFCDDLAGETVVWYDAQRGLRTISGLLLLLEQQPYLLEEVGPVMDDLGRVEASLYSAVSLGVPFCFLLRMGNVASGHEMEVRQGYLL